MRHLALAASAGRRTDAPPPVSAWCWVGPTACLIVFVVIAVVGSWPGVVALNVEGLRAFQTTFPIGSFDPIALLLVFGSIQVSLCLLAVAGAWIYLRGEQLVALSFGLVLVGVALEVVSKATLTHPMVWEEFSHGPGLYPFPEVGTDGIVELTAPFPSGHVLRATYLALTAVALMECRLKRATVLAIRVAAGVFVAGVVFGVLYLGWHWPTDALGGLVAAYALTAPTRWMVARRAA